jgi:hypothetical protein
MGQLDPEHKRKYPMDITKIEVLHLGVAEIETSPWELPWNANHFIPA